MSLILSVGKWGGFYWYRGYTTRLSLGWVALTFIPADIDDLLGNDADRPHTARQGE